MNACSNLQVVRIADGFLMRLHGRGTLKVSPILEQFVTESINSNESIVIDLSRCEYLDSTCLGCLVKLSMLARNAKQRLQLISADDGRDRLFGNSRLDELLEFTAAIPEAIGDQVYLDAESVGAKDMASHVMKCHRVLGNLDTPDALDFRSVADRIEAELNNDE